MEFFKRLALYGGIMLVASGLFACTRSSGDADAQSSGTCSYVDGYLGCSLSELNNEKGMLNMKLDELRMYINGEIGTKAAPGSSNAGSTSDPDLAVLCKQDPQNPACVGYTPNSDAYDNAYDNAYESGYGYALTAPKSFALASIGSGVNSAIGSAVSNGTVCPRNVSAIDAKFDSCDTNSLGLWSEELNRRLNIVTALITSRGGNSQSSPIGTFQCRM